MRSGTDIDQAIAEKREALVSAPADKMMEIVNEIKALEEEGRKFDTQYSEAVAENERMDAESQQAFDAAYEEAQQENARVNAKRERVAALDGEIAHERSRLTGASAEELSNIVQRIRELEAMKQDKATPNEDTTSSESASVENQPEDTLESRREALAKLSNTELEEAFAAANQERDAFNEKHEAYMAEITAITEPIRLLFKETASNAAPEWGNDLRLAAQLPEETFFTMLNNSEGSSNPQIQNLNRIKRTLVEKRLISEAEIDKLREVYGRASADIPFGSNQKISERRIELRKEFKRRGLSDEAYITREDKRLRI